MTTPAHQRLAALDWMRGLVMVFMTLDHVSAIFNRNRLQEDAFVDESVMASLFVDPGNPLHFLTRWVTHLCAPTFVFLAGTALALSVARRLERGDSNGSIDRHLSVRGGLLILLEVWMSLGSMFPVLQVLYAIGASLLCMILLRRLPTWTLVGAALVWMGAGEWFTAAIGLKPTMGQEDSVVTSLWGGLVFVKGFVDLPFTLPDMLWMEGRDFFLAMYPFLPWLAIMMLGWAFGNWLSVWRTQEDVAQSAARLLAIAGTLALSIFVAQRLLDGYGNFWLPRGDDTLLRWLQVSKYPPSLAFYGLELGIMALLLSCFFRFQPSEIKSNGPLMVFGQVALFFFLVHIHLMMLVRLVTTGFEGAPPLGLGGTWLGTLLALVVLYPICRAYRSLKQAHPRSLLRFF
ncbi:MAG: DUF1624 domain-containing protein [bacterium]|nr:DUF1624 domain-containing protein [bacterium]